MKNPAQRLHLQNGLRIKKNKKKGKTSGVKVDMLNKKALKTNNIGKQMGGGGGGGGGGRIRSHARKQTRKSKTKSKRHTKRHTRRHKRTRRQHRRRYMKGGGCGCESGGLLSALFK